MNDVEGFALGIAIGLLLAWIGFAFFHVYELLSEAGGFQE